MSIYTKLFFTRERSTSVISGDDIKSMKSEMDNRSLLERSISLSSLQSQQRQQLNHDEAGLEEAETEIHPSVSELLAAAKASR